MINMKKIGILLLLVFGAWFAQAQHLSFKGIPMQGTTQQFAQKLVAKGFKQVGKEYGVIMMNGTFAGFRDCNVGLVGNEKGNIFKVVANFPDRDKWSDAERDYNQVKEMMMQKYGDPTFVSEDFDSDYELDDWMKKHKIREKEVLYGCVWELEDGSIELTISPSILIDISARITYFDNAGQQEAIQSAIDDL